MPPGATANVHIPICLACPATGRHDKPAPGCILLPRLCVVSPAGQRPAARWAHSATLVGQFMYVFGGVSASVLDELWVLDTGTLAWRAAAANAARPTDRPGKMLGHAAAALGSRVWVFGGQQGRMYSKKLYSLDTATLTWAVHATAHTPHARTGHSMTPIQDRAIIMFGGQGKKLYNDLLVRLPCRHGTANNRWLFPLECAPPATLSWDVVCCAHYALALPCYCAGMSPPRLSYLLLVLVPRPAAGSPSPTCCADLAAARRLCPRSAWTPLHPRGWSCRPPAPLQALGEGTA